MIPARQSTALELSIGPVLDADGVAVTNCVVGDFKIKKTTGNFAALNASATLTHVSAGTYDLVLTTSDTDTVGLNSIAIDDTTNACAPVYLQVIEEAVYDALYAASAPGYVANAPVNVAQFGGTNGTFSGGRPEVNTTHAAGTAWGSGAITAASIASDAITAAKIADGAIDAATFAAGAITASAIAADAIGASELAADALAEIADAVWDEAMSGHTTSGTAGYAANAINDIYANAWDAVNGVIEANTTYINGVAGQASIRAAVGLASANLDTQLGAIDDYLDTELAALTSSVGSLYTTALTQSYRSAGSAPTMAQFVFETLAHLGDSSISGTTKTINNLAGSAAKTFTLNSSTTPTSITEAT